MLNSELIQKQTNKLLLNPLLANRPIQNITQLRIFMEHHVFAVWDFMCLAKSLQHSIAPSCNIWVPPNDRVSARLINEIITVEETDLMVDGQSYCSHFELYIQAMDEVGAEIEPIKNFVEKVKSQDIESALEYHKIPHAARKFVSTTISVISKNKPWITCAAFLFGRENLIPEMFQKLISNQVISKERCPAFEYYLKRHIDIDGGNALELGHSKMGMLMLESLCSNNNERFKEANNIAIQSLKARDVLWQSVYQLIEANNLKCA